MLAVCNHYGAYSVPHTPMLCPNPALRHHYRPNRSETLIRLGACPSNRNPGHYSDGLLARRGGLIFTEHQMVNPVVDSVPPTNHRVITTVLNDAALSKKRCQVPFFP